MVTPEKEAQDLTDKVLNVRFALEKLNKTKSDLETELKVNQTENERLKKENQWFLDSKIQFEKMLAELNIQIQAKKIELEKQTGIFKAEIDGKFQEIADTKLAQDKRNNELDAKEADIANREVISIEKDKNAQASMLIAEHNEKQNAVAKVELDQRSLNIEQAHLILKQKEDQHTQRQSKLDLYEKSNIDRENLAVSKLNTLANREEQLTQLKNALDADRTNMENDKNRNQYVLRLLQELQTRCITNIGQKMTEDAINKITSNITDQIKLTTYTPTIVDKTLIEPAPVQEPEVPEAVTEPTVEEVPDEDTKWVVETILPQETAPVQETPEISTEPVEPVQEVVKKPIPKRKIVRKTLPTKKA